MYVGLEDGTVMILALRCDFKGFQELQSFLLHEERITAMRCSARSIQHLMTVPNMSRHDPVLDSLVTVGRDRQLCVYDPAQDQTRGAQALLLAHYK